MRMGIENLLIRKTEAHYFMKTLFSINSELKRFPGREEALKEVKRFNAPEYTPMYYRTDLSLHPKRVAWLLIEMLPVAIDIYRGCFNPALALSLALVHDDAEILTGDVQLNKKIKMTDEQKDKLKEREREAIENLANSYPATLNGFNYKELLLDAMDKSSLEAQLVKRADLLDGFGEAMHEVYAGNRRFEYPCQSYVDILAGFYAKYLKVKELVEFQWHPAFAASLPWEALDNGFYTPHTADLITSPSPSQHYDFWKAVTLRYAQMDPGLKDGMKILTERKEHEQKRPLPKEVSIEQHL